MATPEDRRRPPGDEVPEADAQEQARDWVEGPDEPDEKVEIPPDAPAADVLEQHREVDLEEEDSPK